MAHRQRHPSVWMTAMADCRPPPWKLATVGLVAGFGGGLASLGGGTLIIPLLSEWLGLDRHQARGTAMAVAGITALTGALSYASQGQVHWPTLLWTGLPAALAAPWAARISQHWSDQLLRRLFGLVLLAGATALLFHPGPGRGFADHWPHAWLLITGVVAGIVAGVLGVSGGPVLAPLFVLGLGMPQQLAQGSSLDARLPAIAAGLVEDHREGLVCWPLLPWLMAGDLAGVIAGTSLALTLPEAVLRRFFALLLVLLAFHEWADRPFHPHFQHRRAHSSYP